MKIVTLLNIYQVAIFISLVTRIFFIEKVDMKDNIQQSIIIVLVLLCILMRIIEFYYIHIKSEYKSHIAYQIVYVYHMAIIFESSQLSIQTNLNVISNTILMLLYHRNHHKQMQEELLMKRKILFIVYLLLRGFVEIFMQKQYFSLDFIILLMIILGLEIQNNKYESVHNPNPKSPIEVKQDIEQQVSILSNSPPRNQVDEKQSKTSTPRMMESPFLLENIGQKRKSDLLQDNNNQKQISLLSIQDKPDQVAALYQNILNCFLQGIFIINHNKKLIHVNGKCEKLFECSGKDTLVKSFQQSLQFAEVDEKKKSRFQARNNVFNQNMFEEMIIFNQQNYEFDILDCIFFPNKFTQIVGYSHRESSSQIKQFPSSLSYTYEYQPLPSIFSYYYTFKLKNNKKRKLKIQFIVSTLNQIQSDQVSQPSVLKNQQSASSCLESNQQPVLCVFIKNVTSKQLLEETQREYQFQHYLLKSFSHELRTPLNCSIQLLTLSSGQIIDPNLKLYIQQALGSNQLLLYQINDILDFAAMECNQFAYQWKIINLSSIIKEIDSLYRQACESKNIQFVIKLDPELENYSIQTDKNRIMQVLVNLLNNSIKFTKENGRIILRLKQFYKNNRFLVKVAVKDNGIGLYADKLNILQRTFTKQQSLFQSMKSSLKKNHIGLGLQIANKLVKGLTNEDNLLDIKSTQAKGTKISFLIENTSVSNNSNENRNLFQKAQSEKRSIKSAFFNDVQDIKDDVQDVDMDLQQFQMKLPQNNELKNSKTTLNQKFTKYTPTLNSIELKQSVNQLLMCKECANILVVDDIPFNQIALKALLKERNLEADSAYDGQQAIEKVQSKLQSQHCKTYKLIFMDIEMPRMNGFKSANKIIQMLKDELIQPNIIMCSAYDSQQNVDDGKKAGMVDFVPKPVRKDDLQRILAKYLSE